MDARTMGTSLPVASRCPERGAVWYPLPGTVPAVQDSAR
jgi:hypothetical protein